VIIVLVIIIDKIINPRFYKIIRR